MERRVQDVTETELAVLQVLWDQGASTLRQLATALYPKKPLIAAQATVLKLLQRLEAKQCVRRKRGDGPQLFRAVVLRQELIGLRIKAVAEQLCEGSVSSLITNFVKAGPLSAKERQELKELLTQLSSEGSRRT